MFRVISLMAGILTLAIGISHGAAFFVLSGSWMGETPWGLLVMDSIGAFACAFALCQKSTGGSNVSR